MKTIPIALAPQYSGAGSTLHACLRITKQDGSVLAVTSADIDLVVDGVTYIATHGLDLSSLTSSANLSVDNADLTVIPEEGDDQLAIDIQTGLFDGAEFELFETNVFDTTDGKNILKTGTLGEFQINQTSFIGEMRGLTQALQQPVGAVTSKTCRARLADWPTVVPGMVCGLAAYDLMEAGTITAVTSRQIVTDSSRAEADDYFGDGTLTFDDGLNAGRSRVIKSFAAGVFTFTRAFDEAIDVGDAYTVMPGCRKRLEEDCRDKFDNVLNFQAEPHLPGVDAITKPPETDV